MEISMDYCVCCGNYVPEGSMVCINCRRSVEEEWRIKKLSDFYPNDLSLQKEFDLTMEKNRDYGIKPDNDIIYKNK